MSQAPVLYSEIGLGQSNYPKLLAACNGTEYLMAAFIPIFIIEKVGRRPLMLFGVWNSSAYHIRSIQLMEFWILGCWHGVIYGCPCRY